MNELRKTSLFPLLLTLCLMAAALTSWAAAAGAPQLVVSSQPSASQSVGFTGLPDDCQSLQATFTLSNAGTVYTFTADPALNAMTGIYTTYQQDGAHVTVYITLKEGFLTQTGTLTLGTLTSNDVSAFTVEKATGLKVLDASSTDTLFPTVDQNGGTGGSDQGSGNTGNGDGSGSTGGSDQGSGNTGNGSGSGNTGGSDQNSGGTLTHPVTIPSFVGGSVTASPAKATKGQTVTLTVLPKTGYVLKSLTVADANGKTVTLREQSGGKYAFTMPASAVTVNAVFEAEEQPVVPQMPFSDVPTGIWYYDSVQYVFSNGLMGGTGNGRFSPDLTTSRGMIVTILYRLEGSPAASGSMFTDISAGQWYSDGVAWASANGIVTGYPDGSFGPDDTITREQMASIFYRYARYKGYDVTVRTQLDRYSDAGQVADYAADAMSWAVGSGIITGTSGTTLSPAGSATRAQAAVILARFCQQIAN